ncbi:MAG: GlsB/YeaQ/YmgE family stress response membrane protein [Schaalia odontolytica]
MLSLIGMVITGAVLGALARLIMRGEQKISILWTIILGAVGALIGGTIASFFGVADTSGIDWIRWALSLVAAIGAISVYLKLAGRK